MLVLAALVSVLGSSPYPTGVYANAMCLPTSDPLVIGSLCFEGATADAYETCIAVTDPTASDKTATLPNATGTIHLAGQALDQNAAVITNIGNAGTDFGSDGGLTTAAGITCTAGNVIASAGQMGTALPSLMSPAGTTQTVSLTNGNVQKIDLESTSGNITVTLTNAISGHSYLVVIQSSTANPTRTVTWAGYTFKWQGGVSPTQTQVADALDTYSCTYDGTNMYCDHGANYG